MAEILDPENEKAVLPSVFITSGDADPDPPGEGVGKVGRAEESATSDIPASTTPQRVPEGVQRNATDLNPGKGWEATQMQPSSLPKETAAGASPGSFLTTVYLHLTSILSVLVVHLVAIFYIRRRYHKLLPPIRAESGPVASSALGTTPAVFGGWSPKHGSPPGMRLPPGRVASEEQKPSETTAQTFDLGSTYEEEAEAKKDQARQQEEGLLRCLFEQNLQLRKHLEEGRTALWSG